MPSYRSVLLVATGLLLVGTLAAESSPVFTIAVPPDRTDLERLNLKAEWSAHLPLSGRQDGVARVQVIDESQVFVQLRSGLLVALDPNTGAQQWAYRYPSGYTTVHPVTVNERYVFAVNVNRLVCLQRYTGLVEFEYEVKPKAMITGQADGFLPTEGPLADRTFVYIVMNGNHLMSYELPPGVQLTAARPGEGGATSADTVGARYFSGSGLSRATVEEFEHNKLPPEITNPGEGMSDVQRTPSLSVLPSVKPPYSLYGRSLQATPSLSVVPTMRQPYRFRPSYLNFNQQTPSIAAIPPSVARVHELANLRPPMPTPKTFWPAPYITPRRTQFRPLLADPGAAGRPARIWLTTEGTSVASVNRANGHEQVRDQLQAEVVAPMAGPVASDGTQIGYVALADGNVLAIDLLGGTHDHVRLMWRSAVGGRLNHKPVMAGDSVYVSGERAGLARVNAATGEIAWKSDPIADRFLAANDEFVYVMDRAGDLLVYDRVNATDPTTRRSVPLAKLDLQGFSLGVANEQTDRILVTADSGLLLCLRDASAKYARPLRVAPPERPAPKPAPKPAAPVAAAG